MQQMSDAQHHARDEEFDRAERVRFERAEDGEIARLKAALAQAEAELDALHLSHAESDMELKLAEDRLVQIEAERDELRNLNAALSVQLDKRAGGRDELTQLLRQQLAQAEQALRVLAGWAGLLPGDTSSVSFDRLAEQFYQETHIMPPGKDVPFEMVGRWSREERQSAWSAWLAQQRVSVSEQVQVALRAIKGEE